MKAGRQLSVGRCSLWLRCLTIAVTATCLSGTAVASASAGPQPFGHACTAESGGVRFCPTPAPTPSSDQRVRSWDGAPLQVDVTHPATGDGPWPTIAMLPSPGPFAVTISGVTIELPAHERPDGGEIVRPLLERTR